MTDNGGPPFAGPPDGGGFGGGPPPDGGGFPGGGRNFTHGGNFTHGPPGHWPHEQSLQADQIALLVLYSISCVLALELIAIFTRVRKNITLRLFSIAYVVFCVTIFAGMGATNGQIQELGAQTCRAQALLMLYLLSFLYVLNFFLTFNVWSAVCSTKFRDQERKRFPIYLSASVLLALIPTIVIGYFNSKNSPNGPPGMPMPPNMRELGFGPHSVYCTYMFPIRSYLYGPLWFNAALIVLTTIMILSAGFRLFRYRAILVSQSGPGSTRGAGGNKRQSSGGSNNGTISLAMCYRFGLWGAVFLTIAILANYRQVRAVIYNEYEQADTEIGVREYAGAFVGIAFWLVFGTGRAAWQASTPFRIYMWMRPTPRASVFEDGYDLRSYYEMNSAQTGLPKSAVPMGRARRASGPTVASSDDYASPIAGRSAYTYQAPVSAARSSWYHASDDTSRRPQMNEVPPSYDRDYSRGY